MAEFQIDAAQFEQLNMQINALNGAVNKLAEAVAPVDSNLSDNIAKWQAQQTIVLEAGFKALIAILGGTDPEEVQARINQFTNELKSSTDALDSAVKANQPPSSTGE